MGTKLFSAVSIILGIASVLILLVVTLFVPSEWLEKQVEIERHSIVNWLGDTTALELINDADGVYREFFVEPGIVRESYYIFVPTKEQDEKSGSLKGFGHQYHAWANDCVRSVWLQVYQIIQRFMLVKQWVWFAIIPIIAAFIDGLMSRKIKQVVYGYASPVVYRLGFDGIILSSVLLLFYMAYPAAPPASPLWPLFWYLSLSVFIRLLSSNVQKMI